MFTSQEPLRLQPKDRTNLQSVLRSNRWPAGWARRARGLLLLDQGWSVRRVQRETGMSSRLIVMWKKRWQERGLDGLLDEPRSGRPKKVTPEKEAAILAATESSPAKPLTTGRAGAWRVGSD
jgi:transposase